MPSDVSSQPDVYRHHQQEHWGSEPHQYERQICPQNADDVMPGNGFACDNGFILGDCQLAFTTL